MGRINAWKPRRRQEVVVAPHDAGPLLKALERHVEAGARRIEFQKVRSSNRWELEVLYYEEEG